MNTERIRLLESYLAEDPLDPFPRYALALEFVNDDPARAEELFVYLLNHHPDYVPTYYHAGQFYLSKGKTSVARDILETGKQKATAAGERKAAAELETLLLDLE